MSGYIKLGLSSQEAVEEILDGAHHDFIIIDAGEWVSDGKYDGRTTIVQRLSDKTFWSVNSSRSGSYYSDYDYYYDTELLQVAPVEKTITAYELIGVTT